MDPKVGDHVQVDGRMGTVVRVHCEPDRDYYHGSPAWIVVQIDASDERNPDLVWVDQRDWWTLRVEQPLVG